MTHHANTAPAANMRSKADFRRAKRHSLYVKVLKATLPLSALVVVGVFAASSMLNFVPSIAGVEGTIGLEDGKLVMDKPKMAGFDKNNRAFQVEAAKAIQDLAKPGMVELRTIDANVPMGTSAYAQVDAGEGTYDTKNERLNLRDNVKVRGARGMDISLEEADIDMKTGTLVSNKPVTVLSDDADITANSVTVSDEGKRIVFKNRVKMIITRNPTTADAKTDDAKAPKPVEQQVNATSLADRLSQ